MEEKKTILINSLHDYAGNTQTKAKLSDMFRENRIPHAIIIEGEPGTGRRTLARIVAKAAVCGGNGKPCGVCSHCKKADSGNHPDIIVRAGGEGAKSFHVSVVRDIRQDAFVVPNEADRKVYLLIGADQMSDTAGNALLKILEEPPSYAVFVLVCRSAAKLLYTVRSRAVILQTGRVEENDAAAFLQKYHPDISAEDIGRLSGTYHGNIGEMETALAEAQNQAVDLAEEMLSALFLQGEIRLLGLCGKLEKNRALFRDVLRRLTRLLRESYLLLLDGSADGGISQAAAIAAERLNAGQIVKLIEITENLRLSLDRNVNGTILGLCLCASFRDVAEQGRVIN